MKEKILKTASQLFAQKGYRKTTLNDIVKKAGTSIGNCYFYYKNKEAILSEIIEKKFDEHKEVAQYVVQKYNITDLIDEISVMIYLYSWDLLNNKNYANLNIMSFSFPEIRSLMFSKIKKEFDILITVHKEEYKDVFNEEFLGYIDILPVLYQSIFLGLSESFYLDEINRDLDEVIEFMVKWILKSLGIKQERINKNFEFLKKINISEFKLMSK